MTKDFVKDLEKIHADLEDALNGLGVAVARLGSRIDEDYVPPARLVPRPPRKNKPWTDDDKDLEKMDRYFSRLCPIKRGGITMF